jgi:hypothetical protein
MMLLNLHPCAATTKMGTYVPSRDSVVLSDSESVGYAHPAPMGTGSPSVDEGQPPLSGWRVASLHTAHAHAALQWTKILYMGSCLKATLKSASIID